MLLAFSSGVTFHKTVTDRKLFVLTLPNILHACNCWYGPKDKLNVRLLVLHEWRQTHTFSQSDCLCFMINQNCVIAFSGAFPCHRWAPFAAERLPFACGWPGRADVRQSWYWVTCSHLELIFSQRLQAFYLYQTLTELCSLSRFLKKNMKRLCHLHTTWLKLSDGRHNITLPRGR